MNDRVVVGLHSTVNPDTQGSFNQSVDGHAWISVTRNGRTQYYGLWPDSHPDVPDHGAASDLRVGREAHYPPSASRYYELTPEQANRLQLELRQNVTWDCTNTCASWASETVSLVTGQRIEATELLSVETPRQLIEEIRRLERQHPTSAADPLAPDEPPRNRSSPFGSVDGSPIAPGQPFHALHAQSVAAVQRLHEGTGRTPDQSSRMAHSATLLAAENGFIRIDHVVLSQANNSFPAGGNLFVVQGALDDPTHQRVRMRTELALATPVSETLQQLEAVQQSRTRNVAAQRELAAAPAQNQEESPARRMG
jgi:hypothetical protein